MASLQSSGPPKVFLSPFVLSTVMLDNSNSLGDQEGFLIGRSYKSLRFEINDQSLCNAEEDLMISVCSAYPCGSYLSFYNSNGVLNVEFIKNFLGDRIKSVVGWYRFRRNVPPYPSAREAIVHRNLMKVFSGNIAIGDHFFVYAVFGSSTSETQATHTYDYGFYNERPDRFIPLGLSMLNLIDTKTKYRSGSLASSFVNSQTFDSVLNIAWSFESCWQTEDGIQQMHTLLRDKCSSLAEELTASECVNATIEDDVSRLEMELKALQMKDKERAVAVEEEENSESDIDVETVEEMENIENIPPIQDARNAKKRYWTEVVDFETEKRHPVYGKYFEQNVVQENEFISQASSEISDNYYILPPQKRFKVLQEHKRVIDHDYSSASDEDSHKFVQDMEEDKVDDLDGSSFTSETEGYISPDGDIYEEVVFTNQDTPKEGESVPQNLPVDTVEKENIEIDQVKEDNLQPSCSNVKDDTAESKTGTGNPSLDSSSSGRPYIIFCKPVYTAEETTNSDK